MNSKYAVEPIHYSFYKENCQFASSVGLEKNIIIVKFNYFEAFD
jgi:hypothetical protein